MFFFSIIFPLLMYIFHFLLFTFIVYFYIFIFWRIHISHECESSDNNRKKLYESWTRPTFLQLNEWDENCQFFKNTLSNFHISILLNPFKWIQFFKNALSSFHISILLNPFKWIQFFKNTLSSFHISILLNPFKWIVYFTL